MMMFAPHTPAPRSYRFVVRVFGRELAAVDKSLRLRCTLNAADQTVVGVSAVALHLGAGPDCDQLVELVHEPVTGDIPPPKYFEVVGFLAPTNDPRARIGGEYRLSGIMDPGCSQIVLPEIRIGRP